MEHAITTTYKPASGRLGARIKVRCGADNTFVPYDYELSSDANHRAAAYTMARYGKLLIGAVLEPNVRVWINT